MCNYGRVRRSKRDIHGGRGDETDEPGVVIQWAKASDHQPAPRQRASDGGGDDSRPLPSAMHTVGKIQIFETQLFLAHNPVVGNQDAGNRTKPARVTEQPYEDVAGWVGEQLPRLDGNA